MMNVIWRIGPCSVSQILEALPPERPLAYTSVSTIVRILEQKQFVVSQKEGRGHLYKAALAKDEVSLFLSSLFCVSLFLRFFFSTSRGVWV